MQRKIKSKVLANLNAKWLREFFFVLLHTFNGSNPNPTKKLAVQLTPTAMAVAMPLADCWNNSVTKNQGIDPGPVANPTTNEITMTMDRYFNAATVDWNFKNDECTF